MMCVPRSGAVSRKTVCPGPAGTTLIIGGEKMRLPDKQESITKTRHCLGVTLS